MKLKEYRKLRGLSQSAFGRLIDVHWTTVARWEAGHSMPTADKIEAIRVGTGGAVTANDHAEAGAAYRAKRDKL